MEENLVPPPSPAPAPDNHPPEVHPIGARRVKRRLMSALIVLYALSIAVGTVLVLRQPPQGGRGGKNGPSQSLLALSQKETVGWVAIHGPIFSSEGGKPWEHGAEQWARRIRAMADTQGVKAIVLDINSPGGSVGAVQELYSQILRVRKEKNIPIVALFGDVAASGGYYIAAACDKIVAHPGTLTGSIGVIMQVTNLEGLFGKVGYKMEPIKSGAHKDIMSPARPMTKEERELLQSLINDAYGQFVSAVASGRSLSEEVVRPLADGRIYSGNQALGLKLVDALGDSDDAVDLAGKLGGISGKPKVRRDTDSLKDFWSMLDSVFHGTLESKAEGMLERMGVTPRAGLQYMCPYF